jgi:CHAD domain-containing protein
MLRRWARHWLRSCRAMPAEALALIEDAAQEPDRRIHAFRRLMKAWRALLRLAPDALADEARALRTEVGELRRSFGASRDAAVVAGTLRRFLPEQASPPEKEPRSDPLPVETVRARVGELAAMMERWTVARAEGDFLLAGFRRTYRRARRSLRDDPREMSVESLHAWRTAVVDLGYQLGFFAPADPARLEPRRAAAERLRSHLGTIVDFDMARGHLAGAIPAGRRRRVEKKIGLGIATRRRKAARIAEKLLDKRPRVVCAGLAGGMARRQPRRVRFV